VLFLLSFSFFYLNSNAQNIVRQTISSAGEYHRAVDFHLSYTIGEPFSFSVNRDGYFWKIGFQQAEIQGSSLVFTRKQELIQIQIWPNPIQSGQSGFVSFENKKQLPIQLRIIDLFGKTLWTQRAEKSEYEEVIPIDFSQIKNPGIYYIGLYYEDVILGIKPWIIY
jgi:hypothetical protein